jgi:hypothetical protein
MEDQPTTQSTELDVMLTQAKLITDLIIQNADVLTQTGEAEILAKVTNLLSSGKSDPITSDGTDSTSETELKEPTTEAKKERPGIVVTWPSKDGGPAIDEEDFKLPPIPGDGIFVLVGRLGVPEMELEWRRFEEVEVTLCLDNAPKTGKVLFLEA